MRQKHDQSDMVHRRVRSWSAGRAAHIIIRSSRGSQAAYTFAFQADNTTAATEAAADYIAVPSVDEERQMHPAAQSIGPTSASRARAVEEAAHGGSSILQSFEVHAGPRASPQRAIRLRMVQQISRLRGVR